VVYGIRPEHLDIAKGIKAVVNVTEPTGPEMHIYVQMGGQEVCVITQERVNLKREDNIEVAPRLDKVHLFDAATGKVIA
ncbi:MAG: TOBE domain-containing protein, partial [Alphaproteobacteria bacterium]|nr:TOBE domain-containing protein [Alphaproteobacteria bacterium]